MIRKAKIVATIGPSCDEESLLLRLFEAGIDVARLNFSHGTHAEHAARIALIRRLSEQTGKPVTIMQDLQGPKMRVGDLPPEGITLKTGQIIRLAPLDRSNAARPAGDANATIIPMDVPELAESVEPGNRILLDDGQMEMEVTGVYDDAVEARVHLGGVLKSHKGVNLPGAHLNIPAFTEKDRADLEFGLQQGVDLVAISFVRRAEDVEIVRRAMTEIDPKVSHPPIIAKLERPEAVENLHDIIHAADGVMVARGDLAVETSPESVPIIQKRIIQMANLHGRVVITATQMLDSMIHNPRPTRAEASDVANAVFDGTDALMLSGETASGSYPVESVAMMAAIIVEAEANAASWGHYETFPEDLVKDDAVSITRAARELAHDRDVSNVAVFTQTGKTALLMSKARPEVPILAFTPEMVTFRRLGIFWGVVPFLVPYASTVEAMLGHVEAAIASATELKPGEQIVFISGFPVGLHRLPNFALLHTIGEIT